MTSLFHVIRQETGKPDLRTKVRGFQLKPDNFNELPEFLGNIVWYRLADGGIYVDGVGRVPLGDYLMRDSEGFFIEPADGLYQRFQAAEVGSDDVSG